MDGKLTEYADTKERGLALRVTSAGVRSWTFRYRNFAGLQRRMSLGRLDGVSLAEARSKAAAHRVDVHERQDPASQRRHDKELAVTESRLETVEQIGVRYFDEALHGRHRPNAKPKRASTVSSERYYFDKYVIPRFGKEQLGALTRSRVQALINDAATGGASIQHPSKSAARQCRVVLHAIFNFAIWQELASTNPCQYVTVPKFESRERILREEELRQVWQAFSGVADSTDLYVSRPVAITVQLAMVTLQRRAEITGMEKVEIDRAAKTWTIPGRRTKNHRTHVVPLSDLALRLIEEACSLAGDSRFVFPSPRAPDTEDRPIEPAALSHAFRRASKVYALEEIRPHDLRRTGATTLTSERLGFPRFVVSQVLNHSSDAGGGAAVTGIYDRNSYLAEKRKALDAWAEHLGRLLHLNEAI